MRKTRLVWVVAALIVAGVSGSLVWANASDAARWQMAERVGIDGWLLSPSGAWGPARWTPVENFGVIWHGRITRSGKPGDDTAWQWLRARGVHNVVNFRNDNEDVDYETFGLGCLWIPLSGGESPSDDRAKAFLEYVQKPENQPVHIMCAEGKDRTGTMGALIRYSIEGWSMDEALAEAALYRGGEPLSDERTAWLRGWANRYPPGSLAAPVATGAHGTSSDLPASHGG
jgi:hypothetical protein